MTDTFRALCAELLAAMQTDNWEECEEVWARAEAALAQPEPVTPTDEELMDLWLDCMNTSEARGSFVFARAVLARWGTPAIQPVPVSERLPGPEDCDGEGRCWWRGCVQQENFCTLITPRAGFHTCEPPTSCSASQVTTQDLLPLLTLFGPTTFPC
jgi:hypothetical protein